ncbi:MAG: hypothetical protein ACREMY_17395, partial [bacterium]
MLLKADFLLGGVRVGSASNIDPGDAQLTGDAMDRLVNKGARMCTPANRRVKRVLVLAVVALVLHAERAFADPVTISGFLFGQPRGAQISEDLTLSFPNFNILIFDVTHLTPGFCDECSHDPVPFTQRTGNFSGHSVGAAEGTIDADVSGN